MLLFIEEFYVKYIQSVPSNKRKPPIENFFHPSQNKAYARFLQDSKTLAASAELVIELKHDEIQRSPLNSNYFWD